MNYIDEQTPLSKSLLTSVFVGITASFVCLVYNGIYRNETGFIVSDIINVGSIIFGVNILFFTLGFLFYLTTQIRKGEICFSVFFLLVTILLAWKAEGVNRSSNHEITIQFRGLLLGIILITGAGIAAIPLLAHSKRFERGVL
jgi:hypothetical protein